MSIVRPMVRDNGVIHRELMPGDIMANGEVITTLATNGAGVWTGAAIAGGIIRRTVVGAGFIDTTDSAAAIMTALRGSAPLAEALQGVSFRLKFINSVAFAHTFAGGVGVVAGVAGGSLNALASSITDYLVTIQNADLPVTMNCNVVNGNATYTFVLPAGLNAFKMGPAPDAVTITPGMSVSGTGVTAGTVVRSVRMGQGGIIGVVTSNTHAGATATQSITFSPTIEFNSLAIL